MNVTFLLEEHVYNFEKVLLCIFFSDYPGDLVQTLA